MLLAVRVMQVPASARTRGSDGIKPGFPRPDTDGFFDVRDEDFPVADPPGLGGALDRLDGLFDLVVAKHNLDFHLGEKIADIFGATVELGVSLLAPKPLGFGDRYSLQTHALQRLLHLVEFERLDDCLDFFHCFRFLAEATRKTGHRSLLSLSDSRARDGLDQKLL